MFNKESLCPVVDLQYISSIWGNSPAGLLKWSENLYFQVSTDNSYKTRNIRIHGFSVQLFTLSYVAWFHSSVSVRIVRTLFYIYDDILLFWLLNHILEVSQQLTASQEWDFAFCLPAGILFCKMFSEIMSI